ncbi:unnamed protein product [Meloidogyne enterolobii]|uniref:Uncharacterized protein n=1 Tax=Meloidogyne enterolobii TaxID=390850 RepID=A0ACB1AN66_MELEN
MLKLIIILIIFSCYCSPVDTNDDKCGKDLNLVEKFFEFLYNDKGIKDEFKSILLNKYSIFITKMANKKARKSRKTKEKNLIEENDKNDSPKSSGTSSLKLMNTEVGNNERNYEGRKEVQIVQTFNELLNKNKVDKNDSPKTSDASSLKSLNDEIGNNLEKIEVQKAKTFTELLNENSDDNKEAEHPTEDRNILELEGRTGWISPESSSKQANIDNYKEVEPTPEGDVDLAFKAHKAQILEELFRDDIDNHKEAQHIPEPAQENSKGVEVVDLTSVPSPSNQSPNHLPDNATNGAFYFIN